MRMVRGARVRLPHEPRPTPRRREALRMKWHGMTARQIAQAMGLGEGVVKAMLEGP